MNRICGLDVSLNNTGVVVMEGNPWQIIHTQCISTKPEHKKRRIYKTDDTIRRIKYIVGELTTIMDTYSPKIIVAELPVGGGQSASAVEAMAISKAVIATFSLMYKGQGLPLLAVNPMDIKKKIGGRKDASKDDIQAKIVEAFPNLRAEWESTRSKSGFLGTFEHVADSIGAVLVSEDDDMLKLLRQN